MYITIGRKNTCTEGDEEGFYVAVNGFHHNMKMIYMKMKKEISLQYRDALYEDEEGDFITTWR